MSADDFRLGDYLRDELARRGMTPSELARVAGVSRSTVSRIVSGERVGDWPTLTRVAQALHMTRGQLVAAVDGQAPPNGDTRGAEAAIERDGNLTPTQRQALIDHYRTYRYPEQRAPRRPGRPPAA